MSATILDCEENQKCFLSQKGLEILWFWAKLRPLAFILETLVIVPLKNYVFSEFHPPFRILGGVDNTHGNVLSFMLFSCFRYFTSVEHCKSVSSLSKELPTTAIIFVNYYLIFCVMVNFESCSCIAKVMATLTYCHWVNRLHSNDYY